MGWRMLNGKSVPISQGVLLNKEEGEPLDVVPLPVIGGKHALPFSVHKAGYRSSPGSVIQVHELPYRGALTSSNGCAKVHCEDRGSWAHIWRT